MKVRRLVVACMAFATLAICDAHAWSIKKSDKTHVRICAVDEEGKPVEGVEVLVRLEYGRGRVCKSVTGKDGMVSLKADIGDCATCSFVLDKNRYYGFGTSFWPHQSGSVVTGVVKRLARASKMVIMECQWNIDKDLHKVGVDLIVGDLVHPYGKGRYADLYMTNAGWRDDDVATKNAGESYYGEYRFERGDSKSEFTIVPDDVGCELPTPTVAPAVMSNTNDVAFKFDYRPQRREAEYVGENRYVIFRAIRPWGQFYGVIVGGHFKWSLGRCAGDLQYRINPVSGDPGIVWTTENQHKASWIKYIEKVYEEGSEAGDKEETKLDEAEVARNREMMRTNAYSGKWGCRAWGIKCVALRFDKNGLGHFETSTDNEMFSSAEMSGWFHWTADGNGTITARAVDAHYITGEFAIKYDCERNMMLPALKGFPFEGRVSPVEGNRRCEMAFMSSETALDALRDKRICCTEITKRDALMKSMPMRTVRSFDELWKLAGEKGKGNVAFVLRTVGAPEIGIGRIGDAIHVCATCYIERSGDPEAPWFEALKECAGPNITGKKRHEAFVDAEEFERQVTSLGGKFNWQFFEDKGVWTREEMKMFTAQFNRKREKECRKLLSDLVGKWYAFPLRVVEFDTKKKD